MSSELDFRYEVPNRYSDDELKHRINIQLAASGSEIAAILSKNGISTDAGEVVKGSISENLSIKPAGAGIDPATIAIVVSLVPVIKALTPLLEPFAKNAADVGRVVALDIWEMVKSKLWEEQHVRLTRK